ncbi:MAG: ATP-binding protein [Limnochordaceae bacterium]|nr:ATP-binding protein [Limnochordaceae bacterium]
MVCRLLGGIVLGVECHFIDVQVDLGAGLPTFDVVGLPGMAVRESRNRVRSAIQNSGFAFPLERLTVNLAPADLPKTGVALDLPIALGILAAIGAIPADSLSHWVAAGELGLDGRIQPVPGLLPIAIAARQAGYPLLAARSGWGEVQAVSGLQLLPAATLAEAALLLRQGARARPVEEWFRSDAGLSQGLPGREEGSSLLTDSTDSLTTPAGDTGLDVADVQGCEEAKRALQVAVAGGHHLLLIGPPGSGKTMLGRRAAGLLPALTPTEALVVSQVYSVAGALPHGLLQHRPWRAPHPSCTMAGMIGGGSPLRPGEVSLAHSGVLFLDELPHFRPEVLEALRVPLEEGFTRLARWGRSLTFPAGFTLVAAMNPCPCGYLGDATRPCRCSERQRRQYLRALSGPFLDRIDLKIAVTRTLPTTAAASNADVADMGRSLVPPEMEPVVTSQTMRAQIHLARQRQYARLGIGRCNRSLQPGEAHLLGLSPEAADLLHRARGHYGLTRRQAFRRLTVARTIADLQDHEKIQAEDAAEAVELCAGWQPGPAPAAETQETVYDTE